MNHIKEFKLKSEFDNVELSVMTVIPEGTPIATVSIVHGMCEYKKRYLPIMQYLADIGYAVIIHDHRGHGESIIDSEDLGYFYNGGANASVEDIRVVLEHIKTLYPNIPNYMIAHSMGSLCARNFIAKYDDQLDGLILSGAPSIRAGMSIGFRFAKLLMCIFGERKRLESYKKLIFGSYNNKFDGIISENDWICSNPEVVKTFDNDPLCGYTFTLNGYHNLIKLNYEAYQKRNFKVKNPNLPIRSLAGIHDPCILSKDKFIKATDTLTAFGYKNVSYRIFDNMRHEVLNEIDKEIVYEDIANTLASWK